VKYAIADKVSGNVIDAGIVSTDVMKQLGQEVKNDVPTKAPE